MYEHTQVTITTNFILILHFKDEFSNFIYTFDGLQKYCLLFVTCLQYELRSFKTLCSVYIDLFNTYFALVIYHYFIFFIYSILFYLALP